MGIRNFFTKTRNFIDRGNKQFQGLKQQVQKHSGLINRLTNQGLKAIGHGQKQFDINNPIQTAPDKVREIGSNVINRVKDEVGKVKAQVL